MEAYHARWREYLVRLVFQKARLQDYSGLPRFAFDDEATGVVGARVAVSLAGLVLPSLCISAVAFARLRRYPVVG